MRHAVGTRVGAVEGDWANAGGSPISPSLNREFTGKVEGALGGWANENRGLVPVSGFYKMQGEAGHWLLNGKSILTLSEYVPTKKDFIMALDQKREITILSSYDPIQQNISLGA